MPGALNLRDNSALKSILLRQQLAGKLIGAICAAPAIVLSSHGLLLNKRATCYPNQKFIGMIDNYIDENVVVDGNIVTSQGPSTSLNFSLKLVELLFGLNKAQEVGREMLHTF